MKNLICRWDEQKNKTLKLERGVSFDDVALAIEEDRILKIISHPKEKYKNQKCLIATINDYPHIVPYVQDGNEIFLKTIYPNRKYKKLLNK